MNTQSFLIELFKNSYKTYLCEEACSKMILIIINTKNRSCLKNVEKVFCPPFSCINLRMDVKIIKYIHPVSCG